MITLTESEVQEVLRTLMLVIEETQDIAYDLGPELDEAQRILRGGVQAHHRLADSRYRHVIKHVEQVTDLLSIITREDNENAS